MKLIIPALESMGSSPLELLLVLFVSFFVSRFLRSRLPSKRTPPASPSTIVLPKQVRGSSLFQTNERTGEKIVSLCVSKYEHALDLYSEAKSLRSLPSSLDRVTKALCVASAKNGRPEAIFGFVRDWQAHQSQHATSIPPSELASAVIKTCTMKGQYRETLALYDQIFEQWDPDSSSRSCLLFCAVEAGELWRAKKFFKEIAVPSPKDCANFIRAASLRGDLPAALEIYTRLNEPDAPVVAALVLGLINASKLEEAEELLGKDGGRLDEVGGNAVLNALAGQNASRAAASLISSSNFNLFSITLNNLATLFVKENSPERVKLLHRSTDGLLAVIKAYIAHGQISSAINILSEANFAPPSDLLTLLLVANTTSVQPWSVSEKLLFIIFRYEPALLTHAVLAEFMNPVLLDSKFGVAVDVIRKLGHIFPSDLVAEFHTNAFESGQTFWAKELLVATDSSTSEWCTQLLSCYSDSEAAADAAGILLAKEDPVLDEDLLRIAGSALREGHNHVAKHIHNLMLNYGRFVPVDPMKKKCK